MMEKKFKVKIKIYGLANKIDELFIIECNEKTIFKDLITSLEQFILKNQTTYLLTNDMKKYGYYISLYKNNFHQFIREDNVYKETDQGENTFLECIVKSRALYYDVIIDEEQNYDYQIHQIIPFDELGKMTIGDLKKYILEIVLNSKLSKMIKDKDFVKLDFVHHLQGDIYHSFLQNGGTVGTTERYLAYDVELLKFVEFGNFLTVFLTNLSSFEKYFSKATKEELVNILRKILEVLDDEGITLKKKN